MAIFEELSGNAKKVWAVAAALGLAVGVTEGIRYNWGIPPLHPPTLNEKQELNAILRPAALNAARAAVIMYRSNPLDGSIFIPLDSEAIDQPKDAAVLSVTSGGYSITVDIRRSDNQLVPKSVYDAEIANINNNESITMTAENYQAGRVEPYFLVAYDENKTVDFNTDITDSDFDQAIKEAKKLAAQAEEDIAAFRAATKSSS